MYIVRKYQQQIDRFICSGTCGAFSWSFGLLVLMLAALGGLIFKFGAPPMNGRPWDSPILLDGAWRIANGQVPHRDFYNHLGDLPFYMTFLGMKLSRPCVSAIDYGNVILMALLAIPTMAVLRRRTSAFLAFLFGLFMALLIITPKPMGDPYDYTDHAMLYNRYGEAFIMLFAIIVLLRPKPAFEKSRANWLEAVLAGAVLIGLLGCKLNYFAVGIGLFAVACVTGRTRTGWALLCACSAAIFLAVGLGFSKIPLGAMVNDYRMMSACESPATRIHGIIIQGAKSILLLPVLLVAVWEGFLGETDQAIQRRELWRDILVIVALFGGAVLLLATDCQVGEMPLLAVAAVLGAEMIQRQTSLGAEPAFFVEARHLGSLLLVMLFLLPSIVLDLKTIRFVTAAAIAGKRDSTETLQSTRLNDFRFVRDGTRSAEMRNYMDELDEGIQLLRRHADPKMRLNGILFSDPFHVALGWVPSSGGLIGMSPDCLVKASHPQLARLLGNATHIMTERGSQTLKDAYGTDWDSLKLEAIEETKNYVLLKIPEKPGTPTENANTGIGP